MNILITGASRGIGFQTALKLSAHHEVYAVSRSIDGLENLKRASEGKVYAIPFDLSDQEWEPLLEKLSSIERLDVLINNAGHLVSKPFIKQSLAEWERTYAVNVMAPMRMIQVCLPLMAKSDHAHIVNIGSMGGITGSDKYPGLSSYSSSKGSLSIMTEVLAKELEGISINCLCLGAVNTEMLRGAFPGYEAPIESQEMADFIADFCLSGQDFFNGQNIPVSLSNP